MNNNELLQIIIKNKTLNKLPLLKKTILQKWQYSHYLHGKFAYDAGLIGGKTKTESLIVAAGVEIGWAAILIIDDIIDNDKVRYHSPSAWVVSGYPRSCYELTIGLLESALLIKTGDKFELLRAYADTLNAMGDISLIEINTGIKDVEPFYKKLGSLSSYSVSWPWCEDKRLWDIAGYETCAGQLVNDCNDCFGKKAMRREYPDIRNHQVSLLTSILHDFYPQFEILSIVQETEIKHIEKISKKIHMILKDDPKPLIHVFKEWKQLAINLARKIGDDNVKKWTLQRLNMNFISWEKKLIRLISN